MSAINLKWTGDQQYLAADEAGHVVVTDPDGQGIKPSDLVLVALAGCSGADAATILQKKRQDLTAIEIRATKQNAPDPPWAIEKIDLEWTVRGRNLKEKAVQDAVHLAAEKYCSVAASLKSEIVITIRVVNEGE